MELKDRGSKGWKNTLRGKKRQKTEAERRKENWSLSHSSSAKRKLRYSGCFGFSIETKQRRVLCRPTFHGGCQLQPRTFRIPKNWPRAMIFIGGIVCS